MTYPIVLIPVRDLFADENCLVPIVTSPSMNQLENLLTSEINIVGTWMRVNKLTLNPAKSNLLNYNSKAQFSIRQY